MHIDAMQFGAAGTYTPPPPSTIPLTFYDLDMNGRICTDPGLAPPAAFECGDRATVGRAAGGGRGPGAAAEAAGRLPPSLGQAAAAAGGQLYLDLMRRSLADFTHGDIDGEWRGIVGKNTRTLAGGAAVAEDAGGTAFEVRGGGGGKKRMRQRSCTF